MAATTIDDLYKPQDGLPLGGVNAPQLDAVGADADVVTLGMGGNDVGFVGLALGCIRLVGPPAEQPCSPAYTAGGSDQISDKIAEVGPELGKAIRDISAKAPHAQVFIVSYPAHPNDFGLAHAGTVVAAAIEQQLAASAPATPAEPASPNDPAAAPPASSAPAGTATLPVTGGRDHLSVAVVLLLIAAAATGLRRVGLVRATGHGDQRRR